MRPAQIRKPVENRESSCTEFHSASGVSKCRTLAKATRRRIVIHIVDFPGKDARAVGFTLQQSMRNWSASSRFTYAKQPWYDHEPGMLSFCGTGIGRMVIFGVVEYMDSRFPLPHCQVTC
jgi:hypothetical protein